MIRLVALALLACPLAVSAPAQGCGNPYDFNALTGSDVHPYAPLDGQDGWTAESFNTAIPLGVTATLGFDGTPALRFQEVGAGYGADASRLYDAGWSPPTFTGGETDAFFGADFGVGYWGNQLALGYDANSSGTIRRYETGEIGPQLLVGSHSNVGVTLVSAAGNKTTVPLSTAGGASGGDWLRLRLVMNFTANAGQGAGSVDYVNLSAGGTDWQPVAGLQGVNLELTPGSGDAGDPANWNGVWLHMEGATNELDNVMVDDTVCSGGPSIYCTAKTSVNGCDASITTSDTASHPSTGANDYDVIVDDLDGNKPGIVFYGYAQAAIPFHGGLLCVQPPVKRTWPQFSGTGGPGAPPCNGRIAYRCNNPGDPAGTTVYYQGWYRNPGDPTGWNDAFSDALRLTFQP